jgi:P-type Ca2+ transporter type 2C
MAEGIGTFMVTAVGVNSTFGKTMMTLGEDSEATLLQQKLNVLALALATDPPTRAILIKPQTREEIRSSYHA